MKEKFAQLEYRITVNQNMFKFNLEHIVNSGHYKTMMSAYRGEVTCEVTSDKALDAATLTKEVETALNGFLQKGKSLLLTTKVDPSIVCGLVVVIGDRYIDISLLKQPA